MSEGLSTFPCKRILRYRHKLVIRKLLNSRHKIHKVQVQSKGLIIVIERKVSCHLIQGAQID
jgi:hypothetical protein